MSRENIIKITCNHSAKDKKTTNAKTMNLKPDRNYHMQTVKDIIMKKSFEKKN